MEDFTVAKDFTNKQAIAALMKGKNIFLTGQAGTGKSHVLTQYILDCEKKNKKVLVCAPTGIAALNLNGITMHQAFNIPIPAYGHYPNEIKKGKIKQAMEADVIIIDEISMCRVDVFEYFGYVIEFLQAQNRNPQIIVSGDFFQLPPVIPQDEMKYMKKYGFDTSGYCFTSRYWKKMNFKPVNLTQSIRQTDNEFVDNLGLMRVGNPKCLAYFNQFVRAPLNDNDIIKICASNSDVDVINQQALEGIAQKEHEYEAQITGNYDKEFPTKEKLILKVGAKVIFVANDVAYNKYHNGSIGIITQCRKDHVRVSIDGAKSIKVSYKDWVLSDADATDATSRAVQLGTFSQLPIKLAYGMTMHKTQGQTYDAAIISPGNFTDGQLYVALSRLSNTNGLYLTREIEEEDIKTNTMVAKFYKDFSYTVPKAKIKKREMLEQEAQNAKSTRRTKKKTL